MRCRDLHRRSAILDLTWKQVALVAGRIDFNPPGRVQTRKQRPIIPHPASAAGGAATGTAARLV
jgi:hypothetical protein